MRAILALLCLPALAAADYLGQPFEVMVQNSTHVVDATVTEVRAEDGAAVLKIHDHIKGEGAATVIKRVRIGCFPGTPGQYGVKPGDRLVLLLMGDDIYDENSLFAVREGAGGPQVDANLLMRAPDARWMPLTAFKAEVAAANETPTPKGGLMSGG